MEVWKTVDLGSNFLCASSAEVSVSAEEILITIWSRVGDGLRTAVKINEDQLKRVVSAFRAAKKEAVSESEAA